MGSLISVRAQQLLLVIVAIAMCVGMTIYHCNECKQNRKKNNSKKFNKNDKNKYTPL